LKHNGAFRQAVVVAVLVLLSTTVAGAQTVPPDRSALEKGEGAGMGMLAEMNGYPGPKHLLDLYDSLRMGPGQVQRIASLYEEMRAAALGKGEMIIAKEEELDDLFGSGRAEEASVRKLASEIGRMRGELRAIHLTAHLKAWGLLTEEQRVRYKAIREATGLQKSGNK
jgi:Spy/CpxP family protein refolding chaperone